MQAEGLQFLGGHWGDSLLAGFAGTQASASASTPIGSFLTAALTPPGALVQTAQGKPTKAEDCQNLKSFDEKQACCASLPFSERLKCFSLGDIVPTPGDVAGIGGDILGGELGPAIAEAGKRLSLVLIAVVIVAIGLYAIVK